jgi:hypothetical protein
VWFKTEIGLVLISSELLKKFTSNLNFLSEKCVHSWHKCNCVFNQLNHYFTNSLHRLLIAMVKDTHTHTHNGSTPLNLAEKEKIKSTKLNTDTCTLLLSSVQIHSAQIFKFLQMRIVCQIGLKVEDQKKLETAEQYTNTSLGFTCDYSAYRRRMPWNNTTLYYVTVVNK